MKPRFAVAVMLFVSLLILANTNVAQAQWSAINSGYAVTTNRHGLEVQIGEVVTATAGTTNDRVDTVKFVWRSPDGHVVSDEVSGPFTSDVYELPVEAPQEVLDWAEENEGVTVYYAQDTYGEVDVPGWWSVQAIFYSATSNPGRAYTIFKATSFFVVDEVPLGTIVMLLIPFGFLGIYAIKRKYSISTEIV